LKPKYYEPLSNFAFSFKLRRYKPEEHFNNPEMSDITFLVNSHGGLRAGAYTRFRGLHSFTFQLNLSRF
jgi:hypothetical protein